MLVSQVNGGGGCRPVLVTCGVWVSLRRLGHLHQVLADELHADVQFLCEHSLWWGESVGAAAWCMTSFSSSDIRPMWRRCFEAAGSSLSPCENLCWRTLSFTCRDWSNKAKTLLSHLSQWCLLHQPSAGWTQTPCLHFLIKHSTFCGPFSNRSWPKYSSMYVYM